MEVLDNPKVLYVFFRKCQDIFVQKDMALYTCQYVVYVWLLEGLS